MNLDGLIVLIESGPEQVTGLGHPRSDDEEGHRSATTDDVIAQAAAVPHHCLTWVAWEATQAPQREGRWAQMTKQPYSRPRLVVLGSVRLFTLGNKSHDTADMKNYYN